MLKKGEGKGRNDPLDYAKSQNYKYGYYLITPNYLLRKLGWFLFHPIDGGVEFWKALFQVLRKVDLEIENSLPEEGQGS